VADTSYQLKDSTRTVVQIRERKIPVPIPGETVTIHDTLQGCPDYQAQAKGHIVDASVKIKNGVLDVHCAADSLAHLLAVARDSITTIENSHTGVQTVTRIVTQEVPKPFLPKIFWWLLGYSILTLLWFFRNFIPGIGQVAGIFSKVKGLF